MCLIMQGKMGVIINEGEFSDCSLQSNCVICKNYKNVGGGD